MAYTPVSGSTPTGQGGSSLSGQGGTSSFLTTQIATSPGSPGIPGARDTSAATRNDPDYAGMRGTPPTMPTTKSAADLIADLYKMSRGDLEALQTRLKQAGYGNVIATGMVDDTTVQAYQKLLQDTASYQAFDNRGLGQAYTPDTLLDAKIAATNQAGANTSVSGQALSDPYTARSLAISSLQSHLGKTPSPEEISAFTSALLSYEKSSNNPDPGSFADAYATSTPEMANQAGAQHEIGFVNVLSSLMGVK